MITRRDVKITVVFTIVEIVTLIAWIQTLSQPVLSASIIGVGLFVEHLISRLKG